MNRNHWIRLFAKQILFVFTVINIHSQTISEKQFGWKVLDTKMSKEFIKSYIETLEKKSPDSETLIQESDRLFVWATFASEEMHLTDLQALEPEMGVFSPLHMDIIDEMPNEIKTRLLSRKYQWDDINPITELEVGSEIMNVFEQRNYKQCRDVFWWTYRTFDISSNFRVILRPDYRFSIEAELGREDLGFPVSLSRSLNIGVSTEILKFFFTLPWSQYPHLGPSGALGQPLDGAWGVGLKFDTPSFGGSVSYQDIEWVTVGDVTFSDTNNVIYNNFSGQIYYSGSFHIPEWKRKIKGETKTIERIYLPPGTLRFKIGITMLELVHLQAKKKGSNNFNFNERARSDRLESYKIFMRGEYVTEIAEGVNKWRASAQLNIGMVNNGFQFYVSRAIKEFLNININAAFYFGKKQFSKSGYTNGWSPGFIIIPSITINL